MDLVSYLRPLRWLLVTFVLLSVAVGLVTAYLADRSAEDTYRGQLGLPLPTLTGQPRELDQVTSDYVGGITSGPVVAAAAEASGMDQAELASSLTANRSTAAGSGVVVEATGSDPDQVSLAVATAAQEAYRQLIAPRLAAAEALAAQLQTEYQEVQASTEGANPDETRRQAQREFAALRALTDARTDVLDLQITVDTVEAAASPDAVGVTQVDRTWPKVQTGLTNGGATLFALIALLVAVELWRTRPVRRQEATDATDRPARVTTADKVPVPPPADAEERDARGDTVRIGTEKPESGELAGSTRVSSS